MILTVRRIMKTLDALEHAEPCATHSAGALGACSRCQRVICVLCERSCPNHRRVPATPPQEAPHGP